IHFGFLVASEHENVFHYSRRRISGQAGQRVSFFARRARVLRRYGIYRGCGILSKKSAPVFLASSPDAGTAVALILAGRLDAQSLACILLMDALPEIRGVDPVVAFDDNGDLVLEAHDFRICDREPDGASQLKAKMLILRVPVEMRRWRFQDVRGRRAAGRNPPPAFLKQECCFWLRAGEAELARIARIAPRGVILSQGTKALRDVARRQPFDFWRLFSQDHIETVGPHELHRARAILTDARDKAEGIAGRDLKFLAPSIEDLFVVRQQSPQKRVGF